ncbi:hypothetical protein Tco_0824402 [Tanacetum coccineum]|uniref:Uncharacterized protein n=1 Tax=Tanacetum coccineum TaxID=301880 RepID=A0ABQ5ALL2_9ASTR
MVVAAMKHMASNFTKLDKFKGVDFRRWQKKMHFLLFSMSVVYVLTTPMTDDGGDNPIVKKVRKRAKWDNDDYNVESSKELWDSLEAKYMAENASCKKFLVSNFTNYKMTDSRPFLEQYNELLDFKYTLKHKKEELNLVELDSHMRIEESLRMQDSDKPKGNNVAGPLVVNMVEHNNPSRFETYVKSKDLDLWHVITNGDFQPIQQNSKTKLDEVIPFEKQSDDLKKKLAKNNKAKMVIYNALPRKEYERIFMCNTAKEIWKTLLITHQGNNQVKDNKIDLLVQQYEQFVISEDETIDSAFARFNTIITSLKALDEESKDLTSLSLDEIIENLKVHKMIIKKDSEICLTSESKDEEYAMEVRDFKKFFKRRGRFVRQLRNDKKTFQRSHDDKNDKNQRAFIGGSWSDSGEEDDEKVKDKTYLVAQTSSEVCSESSYFSDENSSIDDLVLDSEYDKL